MSNDFSKIKVLIACEYSGITREAFTRLGFDATSCDILPTEIKGKHYQGNVFDIIKNGWDLMIAHPPCTYLSYAGNSSWNKQGRVYKRIEALKFFADLWEAPIKRICIENPKGCASPTIAKFTQQIQPYYFGDAEMKTTWLWLKNLPKLQYSFSDNLFEKQTSVTKPPPVYIDETGKKRYITDSICGENNGQKKRSKTFQAIANTMAKQWSKEFINI